jgi:DNA polymerase-3 subunit alpha
MDEAILRLLLLELGLVIFLAILSASETAIHAVRRPHILEELAGRGRRGRIAGAIGELAKEVESDPQVKELWEIALRLEGNARHAGRHASGVVISDRPLTELVPLYAQDGAVMTQYDMNAVEQIGLLKMDFLGLSYLSILDRALEIIERVRGVRVDLKAIPLDDQAAFDLLARGETVGIFQLEGAGITRHLKELRPTRIEDIMAMVALFRPGPMDSIPDYIQRKHQLSHGTNASTNSKRS